MTRSPAGLLREAISPFVGGVLTLGPVYSVALLFGTGGGRWRNSARARLLRAPTSQTHSSCPFSLSDGIAGWVL